MITKENVGVNLKFMISFIEMIFPCFNTKENVGVKLKFMISFIGKDDFFMVKY